MTSSPSSYEMEFAETFLEFNLIQLVNFKTTSSNILDLCLSSQPEQITSINEVFQNTPFPSDHKPISIKLNFDRRITSQKPQKSYNFSKADEVGLAQSIQKNPFKPTLMVSLWLEWLSSFLKEFVPIKTKHKRSLAPWISPMASKLIKRVHTMEKRKPDQISKIQQTRNSLNEQLEQDRASSAYEGRIFAQRSTDKIFQHLRKVRGNVTLPPVLRNDVSDAKTAAEKANLLNIYFTCVYSPKTTYDIPEDPLKYHNDGDFNTSENYVLSILINLDIKKATGEDNIPNCLLKSQTKSLAKSLSFIFRKAKETGIYPDQWKISKVVSIFKKGNRSLVSNYRPVSFLPCASKILGRCLFEKLWSIISPQLTNAQYGFRKGIACVLLLLVSLRSIYQGIDSRKATHILYLDLEKAFDNVDHACLLKKIVSFGVRGYLLKLIDSYLSDRYQRVTIEESSSSLLEVTSGVSQGSIVRPLFVRPLHCETSLGIRKQFAGISVSNSGSLLHQLADDTRSSTRWWH